MQMDSNCSHKYLEKLDFGICCLSCGSIRSSMTETVPVTTAILPDQMYRHEPLRQDLNQIRLIEFISYDPKPNSIACRIITVELEAAPSYSAVSYTWATEEGDARKTQNIYVDVGTDSEEMKILAVTVNCERALKQLRSSRLRLWVDAICIDQDNIRERNHQVSMMGQIYKRAEEVDICIHCAGEEYKGAMDLLGANHSTINILRHEEQETFRDRPEVISLAALFGLQYFSRVWVIQEVILASAVNLHINGSFVKLTREVTNDLSDICRKKEVHIPRLSSWALLWGNLCDGATPSIISCLRMSMNCSASEPRDQVFAIMGLVRNLHVRATIRIDYTLSLHDVLTDALAACIVYSGHLNILTFAKLPEEDWAEAPSFALEHFRNFLERSVVDKYEEFFDSWEPTPFLLRARPGLSITRKRRKHNDQLLQGGSSQECCNPPGYHVIACRLHRRYDPLSSPWLQQRQAYDETIKGSESCEELVHTEGLWATDSLPRGSLLVHWTKAVPRSQILPRLKVAARILDKCLGSLNENVEPLLNAMEKPDASDKDTVWHEFLSRCNHKFLKKSKSDPEFGIGLLLNARKAATRGEKMLGTERHIGFTHGHWQYRDVIFDVCDVEVPLILRPVRGGYRIVGTCRLYPPVNYHLPWQLAGRIEIY